jgi:hypothetical protein
MRYGCRGVSVCLTGSGSGFLSQNLKRVSDTAAIRSEVTVVVRASNSLIDISEKVGRRLVVWLSTGLFVPLRVTARFSKRQTSSPFIDHVVFGAWIPRNPKLCSTCPMLIGATDGGGIRLARLNALPVDCDTIGPPVPPEIPLVSVEAGMPVAAVVPVPAAGAITEPAYWLAAVFWFCCAAVCAVVELLALALFTFAALLIQLSKLESRPLHARKSPTPRRTRAIPPTDDFGRSSVFAVVMMSVP